MLLLTQLGQHIHILKKESGEVKSLIASSEVDDIISFFEELEEPQKLYIVVNQTIGIFLELLFPFYQIQKIDIFRVSEYALRKLVIKKTPSCSPDVLWERLALAFDLCEKGFSKVYGGPRPYRLEDRLYGRWCLIDAGLGGGQSLISLGKQHIAYPILEQFSSQRTSLIIVLAMLGDVRWFAFTNKDISDVIFRKLGPFNYETFMKSVSDTHSKAYSFPYQALRAWYDEDLLSIAFTNYKREGAEFRKDSDEIGFRLGDVFFRIYYNYLYQDHLPIQKAMYRTTKKFLKFVIGVVRWAFENSEQTQDTERIISEFLDIEFPTEEELAEFKRFLKAITPEKSELLHEMEEERKIFSDFIKRLPEIVLEHFGEKNPSNDS